MNTTAYKFSLYILLIALYIYGFGLDSLARYKEESIVTINKILPISLSGTSETPSNLKQTFKSFFL